jgi:hypothetical protein
VLQKRYEMDEKKEKEKKDPKKIKEPEDPRKVGQLPTHYAKLNAWNASLRQDLVATNIWVGPPTPPFDPERDLSNTNIPTEAMHEMLGSFYIWTEKMKPGGLKDLGDTGR